MVTNDDAVNLPYINRAGELVFSRHAPERCRWWAGGQSIGDTLLEIGAGPDVRRRYVPTLYPETSA